MVVSPENRPDPDTLLAHVQGEERQKHRGKLKIFLGYIAGVGKTYEMLRAAHLRKHEGIDVKIGYIETHGRAETEELLEGLPVIPRKMIEYRTVKIPEMDLDAILAVHPQRFSSTNWLIPMRRVRAIRNATRTLRRSSMKASMYTRP
jgi:two-component system sensor histidine kinase KdpD